MPLLKPLPLPPPPSPQDHAVEIVAQHMCTDLPNSFNHSFLGLCGYFMSKEAARRCMQEAGLSANDVDVIELHDCFAPNEVHVHECAHITDIFTRLSVYLAVCLSITLHPASCLGNEKMWMIILVGFVGGVNLGLTSNKEHITKLFPAQESTLASKN